MAAMKLHFLFDPLCGWCYASADTLRHLAERFADELEMHPTGLFAGPGARQINAEFAHFARANDLRIASLTGQPFSELYFKQILGDRSLRFDSLPVSRALTLARGYGKALEPKLYAALQTARYVDGLDTSSSEVVAACTADFLGQEGFTADAQALLTALTQQEQLANQTSARFTEAQALMRKAGATGVPLLLIELDQRMHAFSGPDLYNQPHRLIATIEQLRQAAV